jgi:hypothetical protein
MNPSRHPSKKRKVAEVRGISRRMPEKTAKGILVKKVEKN